MAWEETGSLDRSGLGPLVTYFRYQNNLERLFNAFTVIITLPEPEKQSALQSLNTAHARPGQDLDTDCRLLSQSARDSRPVGCTSPLRAVRLMMKRGARVEAAAFRAYGCYVRTGDEQRAAQIYRFDVRLPVPPSDLVTQGISDRVSVDQVRLSCKYSHVSNTFTAKASVICTLIHLVSQ